MTETESVFNSLLTTDPSQVDEILKRFISKQYNHLNDILRLDALRLDYFHIYDAVPFVNTPFAKTAITDPAF